MTVWISVALSMGIGVSLSSGEEETWPGWRGHDATGVASESAPPVQWAEDKNVRWKTEIPGKGLASPVIWGEFLYVSSAVSTGKKPESTESDASGGQQRGGGRQGGRGGRRGGRDGFGGVPIEEQEFMVMAIHRSDGSVAWTQKVKTAMPHEGIHGDSSFATPTLATDGEILVASFGSYGIFGMSMEGDVIWSQDLGDMSIRGSFGEGSSPVLCGDAILVNWDHEGESFVTALLREDGTELWRKEREGGTSWCTPIVVEVDGIQQVIISGAKTVAYDLESGDELWTYKPAAPPADQEGQGRRGRGGFGRGGRGGFGRSGVINSPVHHDGVLYVCTGQTMDALVLEGLEGEVGQDEVVWSLSRDLPRTPSPLVHEGVLYMMKSNSGILTAVDAESGEVLYGPQRLSGVSNAYASPIATQDHLYFAGRDGVVEVVAQGPEFKTVAVNSLDDGFDASPAVIGNELYLRGLKHLYCIAED